MRQRSVFAAFTLLAIGLPLACGGLDSGEVQIVDAGGMPSSGGAGGTLASGGRVGSTGGSAGRAAGKGGKGGTGTSGDAGEAGTSAGSGGSDNGGIGGSAQTGGTGGSANGGDTATGGSSGAPPDSCTKNSECVVGAPICDSGDCRACTPPHSGQPDECADFDARPYCSGDSGRCVACLKDAQCGAALPICDGNVCRKCESGSECPSQACDIKGRCVDETSVVYALAGTGSYDPACGSKATPCISVGTAASMLSSSRPYLVLIKTSTGFNDTVTIPAGIDAHIFGNGQKISAYSSPPGPGITISGGNVIIDDLIVTQTNAGTSTNPTSAIACSEGNLKLLRVELSNTDTDYNAVGLRLDGCSAGVQQSTFTGNHTALVSSPGLGGPVNTLTVERSLFQGNTQALDFSGDTFTIRNNLFIANGQTSYVRIIKPGAETSGVFAYNTLYSNDNNCSYEGGLIACEYGAAKCGVQSSNLFWHNMFNGSSGTPCADQVYELPAPPIRYTLAEATWPGDSNINADPLLTDPDNGDYTPGSGSPAIDAGDEDPTVVPDVDYFGNPRPKGAHPDIGAIEAE